MLEITVDHLNETREMGLPIPFSAIAQFIPVNEKLCKVICLFGDGSWDSRYTDDDKFLDAKNGATYEITGTVKKVEYSSQLTNEYKIRSLEIVE